MDGSAVVAAMTEARRCAMVMMESAGFIRAELPDVTMSDALRARTEELCDTLVATKHDLVSELAEMEELLDSGTAASALRGRVERILGWMRDDITRMHELVTALDSGRRNHPAYALAYILVAESAVYVLEAYEDTRVALERAGPPR